MRLGQLCSSLNILWHCLFLGLEWKLTFSSPGATAEFSKFAGILGVAFSQHHLLWLRLLLFTWSRTSMLIQIKQEFSRLPVYSVSRNTMIDYPMPWFCMSHTTLFAASTLLSSTVPAPTLWRWDPNPPSSFRFSFPMTAVPTARSTQRRAVTGLFKGGDSLTHLFLSFIKISMPSAASQNK